MRKFLIIFFTITFCVESVASGYKDIRLDDIISSPDKFLEKKLRVIGYIGFSEGDRYMTLYTSKDNGLLKNYPYSIELINKDKGSLKQYCKDYYVSVKGELQKKHNNYYFKVHDYIRVYDRESYELLFKTCEPTDNQIKEE